MPSLDQSEMPPPAVPGLRLLRKIGSGSFGEVWLARHLTTAQLRAVKVVHRQAFATTADFREEFQGLEHYREISRESPFLVSIYQVGHDEELYFYEMDLADDARGGKPCGSSEAEIEGYEALTLKEKVRRAPGSFLPARQTCLIGRDLAAAVACLHDEGFTHRDIKPENIIFVKGILKLADIGTMANQTARKPVLALGYTPDEGAGSPKADLFSLGRTLFFASSGRDPLHHFGSYPEAYYRQDVHERKKLEAIIDRATRQSPKARYGSIHGMRRELEEVADSYDRRQARRRWWIGGAAATLAAGGGLAAFGPGGFYFTSAPGPDPVPPVPLVDPVKPEPVDVRLRVVVLSRSGKDIPSAEVFVGTESHAINWNSGEGWQSAVGTLTVPTETPLYISARAEGYKPKDMEVMELHAGEDMPHFLNVALAPKPAGVRLDELPPDLAIYQIHMDGPSSLLTKQGVGRVTLAPERRYAFEAIAGAIHQIGRFDLYVEPGVYHAPPVPTLQDSVQPILDPRVRAPWTNSLGMAFVNVPGHGILWSRFETRLGDFRLFCQETGRDFRVYETNLWDREKADQAFLHSLSEEEQTRYRGLSPEEQRRFIEEHPRESERKRRLAHPLTKATLMEIEAFGEWLTKRERALGLLAPGLGYRLPSDAEWSRLVGIEVPESLVDPEASGLTLWNLVESGAITVEELRQRSFRLSNLRNVVVTPEVLAEFTPETRRLILNAVRRQQIEISMDRARALDPVTVWGEAGPRPGIGNLGGDAYDPYREDTAPVEETPADANGIHGLAGNVSEAVGEKAYDLLLLRGPSWKTDPMESDPSSLLNYRVRLPAGKEVRNLTFGFRFVLAPAVDDAK